MMGFVVLLQRGYIFCAGPVLHGLKLFSQNLREGEGVVISRIEVMP